MNIITNSKGELMLGGLSSSSIVKDFGTPVYVMETDKIIEKMSSFTAALSKYYDGNGLICYASKAFCCKEICRIAKEQGLGLDVVSLGELYTAQSVSFDLSRVCLHGNNKSNEELELAVKNGVGRIVVDNLAELKRLDAICERQNTKASIMFRIKPGIDAHSHSYVCTGQIDSKFGVALETGEALSIVEKAISLKNINLVGLHCHIGSQILSFEPYKLAVETMLKLFADIKARTGVELTQLNLGGGFGVSYTNDEVALNIDKCIELISSSIDETCKKLSLKKPFLILEPGRSIVGEAGTTLYTVGSVKHIPNIRTYVSVDGGMTDNPRFALYESVYEMCIANRANAPKDTVVTVAGKCCESGDLLGKNIPLQSADAGDILAVFCTGAYNFSMFSHYNRTLRPPVVAVRDGVAKLIVRGDTLEDLINNDI